MADETTILYRPVGQAELDLIAASGWLAFPPRLPEQPIFYPVLDEEYAIQIARDWNAKYNSPPLGYVTRFSVRTGFLQGYEVHTVGGSVHREYWILSEDLPAFNASIVGQIEVVGRYESRA